MAFLHEEEDGQNHKDEKRNKAQRADKLQKLKRHIPWASL